MCAQLNPVGKPLDAKKFGFVGSSSNLTQHASARIRQRGISSDMVEILLQHGRQQHDHLGCIVVTLGGQSLKQISKFESPELWRLANDARSLYAVIDGQGKVITIGHRYRRIVRDRGISFYRSIRT